MKICLFLLEDNLLLNWFRPICHCTERTLSPQINEWPGPGGRPPLWSRLRGQVVLVVEEANQVVNLFVHGGCEAGPWAEGLQICKDYRTF